MKAHGGILNPVVVGGKGFEGQKMCTCQGQHACICEVFKKGLSQRGSLIRIGSDKDFVQKGEA